MSITMKPKNTQPAPAAKAGDGIAPTPMPIAPGYHGHGIESPMPRLIGIKAAAKALGCSPMTVRRRISEGALPHYRIKGRLLFDLRDLRLYLERHRVNPAEMLLIDA